MQECQRCSALSPAAHLFPDPLPDILCCRKCPPQPLMVVASLAVLAFSVMFLQFVQQQRVMIVTRNFASDHDETLATHALRAGKSTRRLVANCAPPVQALDSVQRDEFCTARERTYANIVYIPVQQVRTSRNFSVRTPSSIRLKDPRVLRGVLPNAEARQALTEYVRHYDDSDHKSQHAADHRPDDRRRTALRLSWPRARRIDEDGQSPRRVPLLHAARGVCECDARE